MHDEHQPGHHKGGGFGDEPMNDDEYQKAILESMKNAGGNVDLEEE